MIDTSGFPLPKPGHASGRLVLTGKRYSRNKEQQWERQARRCGEKKCRRYIADPKDAHFHHVHGRGMGGGKRDDRDGVVVCVECHEGLKVQRRKVWR